MRVQSLPVNLGKLRPLPPPFAFPLGTQQKANSAKHREHGGMSATSDLRLSSILTGIKCPKGTDTVIRRRWIDLAGPALYAHEMCWAMSRPDALKIRQEIPTVLRRTKWKQTNAD